MGKLQLLENNSLSELRYINLLENNTITPLSYGYLIDTSNQSLTQLWSRAELIKMEDYHKALYAEGGWALDNTRDYLPFYDFTDYGKIRATYYYTHEAHFHSNMAPFFTIEISVLDASNNFLGYLYKHEQISGGGVLNTDTVEFDISRYQGQGRIYIYMATQNQNISDWPRTYLDFKLLDIQLIPE